MLKIATCLTCITCISPLEISLLHANVSWSDRIQEKLSFIMLIYVRVMNLSF